MKGSPNEIMKDRVNKKWQSRLEQQQVFIIMEEHLILKWKTGSPSPVRGNAPS